ncbi:MAG: hypothetical protein CL693_12270 [Cellvibrionaceae bacterium]|nr:hypothetical protein [Cellvibrionaceae bacterium]|tara:strand:- start:384 stop:878 length:495 start_codon:yes stop_codon:yes gene_type:complete
MDAKEKAPTSSSLPRKIKHKVDPSTFTLALATIAGILFAFIASHGQAQDQSSILDRKESKQLAAQNQYRTALFTAISAAEVNHREMAVFANRQLHQATYCLMLINPRPMQTIAQITHQIVSTQQAQGKLTAFENIKSTFDLENVRSHHPCINQDYPADAILAAR